MSGNLPVLTRPADTKVLAGVCAGVARRLGVEPTVIRVAAVLAAIFLGGLGIVAYLAGIALMPRDGELMMPVRHWLPFTRTWPTAAVVISVFGVSAVLLYAGGFSGVGVGPAVVIFVVWFFGFRKRRPGRSVRSSAEATPFERSADAWRVRLAEQNVPGFSLPPASAQAAPAQQAAPVPPAVPRWQQPYTDPADRFVSDNPTPLPVARPRRSWRLWGLAFALVGVFTLVVAALGAVAGLAATPVAYASAVLAAFGVTALVAMRKGRPPLLIPATLIAALVLCGLMADPQQHGIGIVGDVTRTYTSAAELPAELDVLAGDARLDLTDLQLTGSREFDVHVRVGDVQLQLPEKVASKVDWTVKLGDARIRGGSFTQSFGQSGSFDSTPSAATGLLTIKVIVEAGDLEVGP